MVVDATRGVIGRNILANAIGGSWSILLALAVIPIQIRVLGIDAFGLLAFIASLQVLFNTLDLGLSPTIAREVAIDNSTGLQHSRDLLQTLSVAYVALGVILGGAVIAGAGWLAEHWLKLGALPFDSARSALQFGGLVIMFRWPVSFFTGVLMGRGRFGILNLLRVTTSTVALLGGALLIVAFANLVVFTAWLAVTALLEAVLYLAAAFRLVPGLSLRPRISREALARVRHFAVSMSVVRVLNIAIRESDHLMLSVLAPIETLGYYALAYRVVSGLSTVQGFVTTALFPTFAAEYARGAMADLVSNYNRATRGLVFLCAGPVALLMFFGYPILRIWTSAEMAGAAAPILTLLAPGFLLGVSVAVASTLAPASGHTGFVIRRNVVGLGLYLPLLYIGITRWGAIGAAAVWLVINVSFLFTLLPSVQQRIVGQSMRGWLERNLLPFVATGAISFGTARGVLAVTGWQSDIAVALVCAVAALIYGLWGLRLIYPDLRGTIYALAKRQKTLPRGAH